MNTIRTLAAAVVAATAILSGCASNTPSYNNGYNSGYNNTASMGYGTIESIQVTQAENRTSGTGAIVGGLVGALAGNQVGSGSGRTAATVAGAIGGAMVGRNVERNARAKDRYEVVVRYAGSGATQTLQYDNDPGFRVGEAVRVNDGVLSRDQ